MFYSIGAINHPERIQAVGAYSQPVTWYSGLTIAQIQSAVMTVPQGGAYRLRREFDALLTGLQNIQTGSTPVGAIIFIPDTSDQALLGANDIYNQLTGVNITFVLLGPNPDQSKLTNFSSNFITWRDLSQPQPDNWNNLYGPAYGCNGGISTISPTSAMTTSTPPVVTSPTSTATQSTGIQSFTTTFSGYIPCQSWIGFGIDDSNVLSNNNFMSQLTFISSAIGNITHPERIAAIGAYSQPVSWNSGLSLQQIQAAVTGVSQSGPYSLRMQFGTLVTNLQSTQTGNTHVGALIFISDTSDAALAGADQFLPQLTNVRITFVLLGQNADQTKLTQFASNFIFWQDLSIPQPYFWNNDNATAAYGCN
uniref:VWFA domain-containing protein n=1 Tax=Panagrolaimus davidi TaxID=227884 RepID=A0A914PI80_9BILA